ncbi:hypothetical protein ACY2LV_001774 [Acinetobacter baumannii]
MLLDRVLQLELMKKMASTYPLAYDFSHEVYQLEDESRKKVFANLYYLQSHELLEPKSIFLQLGFGAIQNSTFTLGYTRLTQKGADFMANDGGLSAIFGVVTIKFEADQFKTLLESKIMATDLPPADKRKLIDGLRSLSGESIKHLTTKNVDLGWDNLGTLIRIIQSSLA